MGYIAILVTAGNLEHVMFDLLAGFHGWDRPEFEVHNAWSLSSDVNELYLSPVAYACLVATAQSHRFHVIGEVERPPAGCDMLMGDQSHRPASALDLPTYFSVMQVDDADVGGTRGRDR